MRVSAHSHKAAGREAGSQLCFPKAARDPLRGLGSTFVSDAGSVPSCTGSSPPEAWADIRELNMSMDWCKTAWARCCTKNPVVAAKRDGLAQSSFLHSQMGRGSAGLLDADTAHGPSEAELGSRDLAWTANQDLFVLAVLTLCATFSGEPGLSLQKQSRVCFIERQLMFSYPPLFSCKEDPDHQFLSIMEKRTRLRLRGQQALGKKE